MAWICPMCSSGNEDSQEFCFVCNQKRTEKKVCTLTLNKVEKLGLTGDVIVPIEFNVIGEGAFQGRTDIRSISIHSGVTKICKEAFAGCTNLSSITCMHELDSVGSKAFAECTSLPVSERVMARYVADDAYYVTKVHRGKNNTDFSDASKPKVKVRTETTERVVYRDETLIPPSLSPIDSVKLWSATHSAFLSGLKTPLKIFGVYALIILILISNFVNENIVISLNPRIMVVLGVLTAATCLVAFYAMIRIYIKDFSRILEVESLIIPITAVAVLIFYLLCYFGSEVAILNHLLCAGMLFGNIYLYARTVDEKKYQIYPITVTSFVLNLFLALAVFCAT